MRKIFNPETIALIGATEKEHSVGRIILDNLLLSEQRKVFPVNPSRETVLGHASYPNIRDIAVHVDLAVISVRAEMVPRCLEDCGLAGVEGVIIVSSGFSEVGPEGKRLEDEVIAIRNRYGMRVMGPNSIGIIRPTVGLNTTPIEDTPDKGNIAFITESGAFGRALLEWGISSHIGFSLIASLGAMIDVDFGDLIDFLGEDPYTRSIMIYMEHPIDDIKRFASAAKGFALNKPIIVLRPVPAGEGEKTTRTLAGLLADHNRMYDALFKRIGVVRVKEVADIFNVASVLHTKRLPKGSRLLIITNAGGVGTMATNTLVELGGEPAVLSEESLRELDKFFPNYWNRQNPIYLLRDAEVERFSQSISIGLRDPGVDGILIVYTFQAAAKSEELARTVIELAQKSQKPIIISYMGGTGVIKGRKLLLEHNIPSYDTPEEAVKTYMYMYRYKRNLELLYETPSELAVDRAPPKNNLRVTVRRALKKGTTFFGGEEAARFLSNYGIPTIRSYTVLTFEEAARKAKDIKYPVVLKVVSPDVFDRADAGGPATGIQDEEQLRHEFERVSGRIKDKTPGARATGITIRKMVETIDYEVMLGAKRDSRFGSMIVFGMGGAGAQVFKDFSIALPPLNQILARRLMEETQVYKLHGYRGRPPADLQKMEEIIVAFSNLIVDFPEIAEIDVNPIAVSDGKAYVLDTRIIISDGMAESTSQYPHLVITPYPARYIMPWTLSDGTEVLLRPIRPEDEPLEHEMLSTLSDESLRTRFFQTIRNITHEMHVRFCNIDYDREMAIVAEVRERDRRRIIGIARLVIEPSLKSAEYAVVVHDNYHGKGLGYKLVDVLIGFAQDKGLEEVCGYVQSTNLKMLNVCKKLGFTSAPLPDHVSRVCLPLK
ncbi:bifunctional acetate--CoA ligase family protein/GNAT family N-acetyltransferase [Syntrophorhabdus aromaticivorans]|uniref:bifunctional acetate--CoA ligase family protein/GNAT family N-acetyltransferase n=1 Tax=Syntrophorhabdus aromaticivorans TaxID=328301 RepID=UPI0004040B26|nr:GNAT family N-acetyltransferase [Syntrophorhabdus aromaticivorans]